MGLRFPEPRESSAVSLGSKTFYSEFLGARWKIFNSTPTATIFEYKTRCPKGSKDRTHCGYPQDAQREEGKSHWRRTGGVTAVQEGFGHLAHLWSPAHPSYGKSLTSPTVFLVLMNWCVMSVSTMQQAERLRGSTVKLHVWKFQM